MDTTDLITVIALCITCFTLGYEIGKDIMNILK